MTIIWILLLIPLLSTIRCSNAQSKLLCQDSMNPSELQLDALLIPTSRFRLSRPYLRTVPRGYSAHHVIPYHRLRDFFNAVVNRARDRNNCDLSTFGFCLERMVYSVYNRLNYSNVDTRDWQNSFFFTRALQYYPYSSLTVSANSFFEGWLNVVSLFTWLPGNIFIGPSGDSRHDDPGSSFEVGASSVFDVEQYNRLQRLDDLLTQYINNNTAVTMRQIGNLINEVNSHAILYNYDTNDWARDNLGKFGILPTRSPHDENRRRKRELLPEISVLQNITEDNCRGVHKSERFFINDKTACKLLGMLLLLVPHRVKLQIDGFSEELKSFEIKDNKASAFENKDGMLQEYYISGMVEDIYYTKKRCYVAIDDSETLYTKKHHFAVNENVCTTAVEAFIMEKQVYGKVRLDPVPNFANDLLELNFKELCFSGVMK